MTDIEFLINIIVIGLLIPVIFFSWRLSRNLNILRNSQSSLPQLIQTLNEAASKAESAVAKLKNASALAAQELKEATDGAGAAKDNLAFVCEKAENLSNLLENTIYATRSLAEKNKTDNPEENIVRVPELPEDLPGFAREDEPSEAENELLQALRSIK